jgi:hypothetical protein
MTRLGFGHVQGGRIHLPHQITRLAHRAAPEFFLRQTGGIRVRILLRKRSRIEIRVTFTPQVSLRKAWRLVSQLGLHPSEGSWA